MYKMHKPINAVRRQDNGFSRGEVAGIWKGQEVSRNVLFLDQDLTAQICSVCQN